MTFFLPKRPADEPTPRLDTPQEGGTPTVFESFTAGFEKAQLENDSNFRLRREVIRQSRAIAEQALPRLDGVEDALREKGFLKRGRDVEATILNNPQATALVLDLARQQATANPDAWSDIDLSDETITKNVQESLQAEYQDALDVLQADPRLGVEFIAGMAGITADVKNVPFLLLGGGAGSFIRVAGREALINMAAEGSFMPSQFQMADVLDIADPNVPQQLALAAGAGAVFGVGVEGVRRAAGYFLARQSVQPFPGHTRAESEAIVDDAEDALQADPFSGVREAMQIEPRAPEPPPGREPLLLRPSQRVPETDAQPVDDGIITGSITGGRLQGEPIEVLSAEGETVTVRFDDGRTAEIRKSEISDGLYDLRDDNGDPLDFGALTAPYVEPDMAGIPDDFLADMEEVLSRAMRGDAVEFSLPIGPEERAMLQTSGFQVSRDNIVSRKTAQDLVDERNRRADARYSKKAEDPPQAQLPPPDDPAIAARVDEIDQAITEAEQRISELTKGNPLIRRLARNHLKQDGRRLVPSGNERLQINPDGQFGRALRGRDIRPKTFPGLFSKEGRNRFDNLVAEEWEDSFPGITDATGSRRPELNGYLDEEGFMEVLERAARGDYSWHREVAEEQRILDGAEQARNGTPAEDFMAGRASDVEGGLYIRPGDFDTEGEMQLWDAIGERVDDYLEENYADVLSRADRDEIIYAAQTQGGDVDLLAQSALNRELRYAERDDIPWEAGGPASRDAEAGTEAPGARPAPGAEGSGGTGAPGRAADAEPAQAIVPGTDRVQTGQAQADSATIAARQQQSRIGRLAQDRVEDDPTSMFGTQHADLFDDPASPKAQPLHDGIADDLRAEIERDGDFMVDMGDGKGERAASAVLRDIDDGMEFADAIALCGRPRGSEAPF